VTYFIQLGGFFLDMYTVRLSSLFICENLFVTIIRYSFLSFRQVHLWYDFKMAGLRSRFVFPVGNTVQYSTVRLS
jgi:hypothetical protein